MINTRLTRSPKPDNIKCWQSCRITARSVSAEGSENWNNHFGKPVGITEQRWSIHALIPIISAAAAAAKLLQSCPTLCDPRDGSPPGSPVPGILQARTLEWVAISFSKSWKWKVKVKLLSRVWLFATPWTAAYQAPPSMGFSRQEYWSGVPLPSPTHQFYSWVYTEIGGECVQEYS